MNMISRVRVLVVVVLLIACWTYEPWRVSLLLTILAVNQEMQNLTMRRLLSMLPFIQKLLMHTPPQPGAPSDARQTG